MRFLALRSILWAILRTPLPPIFSTNSAALWRTDENVECVWIALLNTYLLSLMQEHLTSKQYDVVRLFYGLDCNKHSAKEIADYIGLRVPTATVIVSQIKKEAIDHLIANVDSNQVIDYL